ncbi:hypothetical protein Ddye_027356 [Dipteronia dyeriana]|uniref:Uncharacterized protein n=1 Tax=Dipteronia dyeriana TaxID=168575 RepID=A0AAD9TPK9_9ROSI|nr:hypothetical protein Ddye_027356 [Dipteronia dyeriana]
MTVVIRLILFGEFVRTDAVPRTLFSEPSVEQIENDIDGILTIFYQKYWGTIGKSITKAFLRCLNDEESLVIVNSTLITLISKLQQGESLTDFFPISLCNVIYKIVAKH